MNKENTGFWVFILFVMLNSLPAGAQQHLLQVSPDKRYLVNARGEPFFYLGDTAWELFHRLSREEADTYLRDRAAKGFTVIQAVVLAERNGLQEPNAYGALPLKNMDPRLPNEAYFQHVDAIVDKAAGLGLYIGMLPTWGDKVFKNTWGDGPEVFTPDNARAYGQFLGRRYAGKPIIWIVGGDRNPRHDQDVAIWRALAAGITEGAGGDPDQVLMTFHPQPKKGGGSSTWFHDDAWLDFNMFQTGHCRDVAVYDHISHDYQLPGTKPTMDGEPIYEDHPVCFNARENGYSKAYDVRRAAYLALFAGAHGHTYGAHAIWQMNKVTGESVNGPLGPWTQALHLPGAGQMSQVRALMESRPMLVRVPDQGLVAEAHQGGERIQATRGQDYAFIYSSAGLPIRVQMGRISGKKVRASWFDPRTGYAFSFGTFKNTGTREFVPPSRGRDNDWVLVLDDAGKGYDLPKPWKKL